MYNEIRRITKEGKVLPNDLFVRLAKRERYLRIRWCLFHVWLVALTDFLSPFKLFFRRNKCCEHTLVLEVKAWRSRGLVVNSKTLDTVAKKKLKPG